MERPDLFKRFPDAKQLDAVRDLVGNGTILDSLDMLRRGSRSLIFTRFYGWRAVFT